MIKYLLLIVLVSLLNSCAILSLLNSGTANVKYTVSEATLNDGVKYEEVERISDPSFSIRNVQHPKTYGKWNVNLKVTPSLHYDDTTYQTGHTRFNKNKGREEELPNINIKRFMTLANLKLTGHTPIGAFALSGGFGGSVYKMDDGQGLNTIKTREMRKIDLAWYAFMSKHFFLLMGPRYYKAGYESYVFAFRIGYYWGK